MSLKGNLANLHDEIKLYFEDAWQRKFEGVDHQYYETSDGENGRMEIRRYWTVKKSAGWRKKLSMIGMAQCERSNRIAFP